MHTVGPFQPSNASQLQLPSLTSELGLAFSASRSACVYGPAMHRNRGTKYATRAAPRGKGGDGTRRKYYAPGHRATKFGKSSPGQCALSSGSSQHVGQSLPLLQPKGSHHVLERLSHSQQWSVLSQYAPSLQSEWESQAAGVIVELPVPAPKAVCMEEQKSVTSSV